MRPAVLVCAATLALSSAVFARQPSGEGDPAATRCMRVEGDTGHLGGETVCKTNAEWAALKAAGIELDQFGYPIEKKDARGVADHGCTRSYGGGPRSDGTRASSFDCR